MEILINDKAIAFELDKKLSLNELLENIQNWAGKDNLFILDFRVNGEIVPNKPELYNSENINKLEVLLGTRQILIWENLVELNSYIQKIYSYLIPRLRESDEIIEIDAYQLSEGLAWILNSYDSLKKYFQKSESDDLAPDYIETIIKNENYVLLINTLKSISIEIDLWKKQIFYTLLDSTEATQVCDLYREELKFIIDSLESVAADLTIGKDQDALKSLENIIEWLSIGLIIFEKSGTDTGKINQVKETLNQLNEALVLKDFVSLADILDFDLRDSLNAILL